MVHGVRIFSGSAVQKSKRMRGGVTLYPRYKSLNLSTVWSCCLPYLGNYLSFNI